MAVILPSTARAQAPPLEPNAQQQKSERKKRAKTHLKSHAFVPSISLRISGRFRNFMASRTSAHFSLLAHLFR